MINKLIWPLRILFFLFFFISGFSKIYPNIDVAIHLFEKEQLMSIGIPFCLSTWLSRGLIALEFSISIAFLVPFYFKRFTLPLSSILIIFFSLFLVYEVFILGKWSGNCGCFGQLIPMTPPVSLVKNIIALLFLGFLFWKRSEISEKKTPSIIFLLLGYFFVFILICISSPNMCFNRSETIINADSLSIEVNLLKDKFPKLQTEKSILCFYSPTCPHCMNTAKILQSVIGKTGVDTHYVVFMSDEEDTEKNIKKFLMETKLKAKYTTMKFIDFPTDTDVPAILLVKNGKVEKRFFGNDEDKKFNKNKFLEAFYKLD